MNKRNLNHPLTKQIGKPLQKVSFFKEGSPILDDKIYLRKAKELPSNHNSFVNKKLSNVFVFKSCRSDNYVMHFCFGKIRFYSSNLKQLVNDFQWFVLLESLSEDNHYELSLNSDDFKEVVYQHDSSLKSIIKQWNSFMGRDYAAHLDVRLIHDKIAKNLK